MSSPNATTATAQLAGTNGNGNGNGSSPAAIGQHQLITVDAPTLNQWRQDANTVVIDVREDFENAVEHIPGSLLRPLSAFDPDAVRSEHSGKRIVFYCRSGRRSADAGNRYRFCTEGTEPVYHLEGGITAWKAAGLKVDRAAVAPPLDVLRQVQITVGFMVLLGTVLGWLVSPWFLLISGFMGAGLFFAGVTGTCALATCLARMPWNRLATGVSSCTTCTP